MFNFSLPADEVLDVEPWLNVTWACQFAGSVPVDNTPTHVNPPTLQVNKSDMTPFSKQQVQQYTGRYGNFAYGNITVVGDDVSDDLFINFDVFTCQLHNVTSELTCQGQDEYWFLNMFFVAFDTDNAPSQFVDILFSAAEGLIRFERDLRQEDAPGPTDHWLECEDAISVGKDLKRINNQRSSNNGSLCYCEIMLRKTRYRESLSACAKFEQLPQVSENVETCA